MRKIKDDNQNLTLQISDLILVASLIYFGFQISSADLTDPTRVIFEFENIESAREKVDKFWKSELSVEPRRFNYILRELKAQIRNEALPISR